MVQAAGFRPRLHDLDGIALANRAIGSLPPHHHELTPTALTATVRDLIEELLPLAPRCAGIVLCTQMHSVVLVNNVGTPLTNIVTWLDQRVLEPHPAPTSISWRPGWGQRHA